MSAAKELIERDVALERWEAYLKSVATGASPTDAMQLHGILWREIESIVLSSPADSQRWRDARLQGTASRWPLLDRDEIFARLARGVPVEKALIEVRGTDAEVGEFFELIEALADFQERFDASQRARDLREEQGLLEIVDDTSRDILDTGKGQQGNTAAVLRSKLRWEARTWRLAKNNPKRWGEQKAATNVQVNIGYAETLEAARTRSKVRDGKVTQHQMREAVDAVFSETPVPTRTEKAAIDATFMPEPVADAMRQAAALEADAQQQTADQLRDAAVVEAAESEPAADSFGLDD